MPKPTANDAYYQGLLTELDELRRPKTQRENTLRKVRIYERLHGIPGRNYNGK